APCWMQANTWPRVVGWLLYSVWAGCDGERGFVLLGGLLAGRDRCVPFADCDVERTQRFGVRNFQSALSLTTPGSFRHSGKPAVRSPATIVARFSGRWIGSQFLIVDRRNSGSSWRSFPIVRCAWDCRPASASLAARMATASNSVGSSRSAASAQEVAR